MRQLLRKGKEVVDLKVEDGYRPEDILRLRRMARELRLINQMLSDADIVEIVEHGPAPAWTTLDGSRVSFNLAKMPLPKRVIDVMVWVGTDAHELGHARYSPREDSALMQRCINADRAFMPGLMRLHNIVEDQREERLMLADFSPWQHYLVAALSLHLAVNEGSWLLMTGRTWLPQEVRLAARAAFVAHRSEHVADEVTRLVGDYQRLTDPGDTQQQQAWDILEQLHALFDGDMPEHGGCGNAPSDDGGDPITDEPTNAPPTADEAQDDSDGGDTGSGDTDTDTAEDGDQADGGDTGKGDTDSDDGTGKSDEGEPGTGNAGGTTPDGADTDTGSGAGDGGQPPTWDDPDGIRKALEDAAQDGAEQDAQSKKDLDSILDALDHGRGSSGEAKGDVPVGSWVPVTDAARRLQHQVGDALLDLKDATEAGWVRRVERGRLSVRRYIQGASADELYDRFDPGVHDASEMEVVVIADTSSSMHWATQRLGEAMWAIHRSVDELDGKVTLITWSDGPHHLVAGPGTRATGRMFVPRSYGGTVPNWALDEAFRLLSESTAKNRMLLILTDGGWFGNEDEAHALIDAMSKQGITTALAFLEDTRYSHFGRGDDGDIDAHHCQLAVSITAPKGLAMLFRQIAEERIRSWM